MKFWDEAAVTAVQTPLPQSRENGLDSWNFYFSFFHSENQLKKKNLATYYWVQSHTLIPRSDEVMKFWDEAAVIAVRPPPPPPPPTKVGNWTGFVKKKISFFSLRKSTEKKFVAGKVHLLAPKPTHLVFVLKHTDT